jgi:TRAP-type transport system small permease protein
MSGTTKPAISLDASPTRRHWGAPWATSRAWAGIELAAASAMFAMMGVGLFDVVGRKLWGRGLPAAAEITELLMIVAIYAALPLVSLRGAHVQLELIDSLLPPALQRWRACGGDLLCALLMAGAGWLALTRALQAGREGEVTMLLRIGLAPYCYAVAALFGLTALIHLRQAFLATTGAEMSRGEKIGAVPGIGVDP